MASQELIKENGENGLDFGVHTLKQKEKFENFIYKGDSYKVKTFNEITRLEKNDALCFESVPGTTIDSFVSDGQNLSFNVTGSAESARIVLGLKESSVYLISVNGASQVASKTNISGKLDFQIHFIDGRATVKVTQN